MNSEDKGALSSPISSLSKECAALYHELLESLRKSTPDQATENGFDRDETLLTAQDARSRFKAWGNSIAAFQDIGLKSSLDARLRDATDIRSRILKVLVDLQKSLSDGKLGILDQVEISC